MGFPRGTSIKNQLANAGDIRGGLIPGLGRSSGGGYFNSFQYSYLKNPMDQEAWWATQRSGHD